MAIASSRVVERERESSSRVMDYNAPPNSWTFGKAQQEIELSSGLSNSQVYSKNRKIEEKFTKEKKFQ